MEYKIIKIGELIDFIESDEYKNFDYIPISPHRAISHFYNPRASKDDVALIIAKNGHKILAYIGALPDLLVSHKNEKIAWLSCWKSYNNSGARQAVPILKMMIEAYDGKVLFGDMTPTTKNIYNKLGLGDFFEMNGLKAYYKLNLKSALENKYSNINFLKLIGPIINAVFNFFTSFKRLFWEFKIASNKPEYFEIETITGDLCNFIETKNQDNLVRRDANYFNWIKKYPWILSDKEKDNSVAKRYFFSAYAKKFEHKFFQIKDEGKIKAFVFLQIRDGKMKIPYVYFEKENLKDVVYLIYNQVYKNKINVLELFHQDLVEYLNSHSTPFFYKRKTMRNVGAAKDLKLSEMSLYDGDGDVVFT
jgi:hypothetical protein